MKKKRLLGAICVCVLSLVYQVAQASTVTYTYTGMMFTDNNDPSPFCVIGDTGCYNNITATIELSTALGNNLALADIMPDAWSISDGLTTITDQTDDFSLFSPLQVGTNNLGKINEWRFIVDRTGIQLIDKLIFMQTINSSGANDASAYCREPNGTSCNTTGTASVTTAGSWTVSSVPIPAAVWLFTSGLIGLFGLARRRRVPA